MLTGLLTGMEYLRQKINKKTFLFSGHSGEKHFIKVILLFYKYLLGNKKIL